MMPIVPSMPKMAEPTWYASSELRRYELSADSQAAIGAMTAIETGATMGGGAILATGVEMVQGARAANAARAAIAADAFGGEAMQAAASRTALPEGSFSIVDWSRYPANLPNRPGHSG
jgi:hypothetical protein